MSYVDDLLKQAYLAMYEIMQVVEGTPDTSKALQACAKARVAIERYHENHPSEAGESTNTTTQDEGVNAALADAYKVRGDRLLAAGYLIEQLDRAYRGIPVRDLDEAWEAYRNSFNPAEGSEL